MESRGKQKKDKNHDIQQKWAKTEVVQIHVKHIPVAKCGIWDSP